MKIQLTSLFVMIIVISLIASLAGCGESKNTESSQNNVQTTDAIKTATRESPNKTIQTAIQQKQNILINIPAIAGKTQNEVSSVLGSPSLSQTVNPSRTNCPCPKNLYQAGKYEIVFMNGVADWITINSISNMKYEKESLEQLGLPVSSPTFSSSDSLRLENVAGLKQVEFFPSGDGISYIYLKANTS